MERRLLFTGTSATFPVELLIAMVGNTRRKYASVAGFIAGVFCRALVCRVTAWAIGMIKVRTFKILLRRGFFKPGTQA